MDIFRMVEENLSEANMSRGEMLWSVGFHERNVWTEYHFDWQSLYWVPNAYQSYVTGYVEEQLLMRLMILDAWPREMANPACFTFCGVSKNLPKLLA